MSAQPSRRAVIRSHPLHRSAKRGNEANPLDRQQADRIVNTILTAASTLEKQTDLSPDNPVINEVLSKLVGTITEPASAATALAVLDNKQVKAVQEKLWDKLSAAEGAMENWWSAKLLRERRLDLDTLEQFWYRDNYKELTALEVKHWADQGKRPDADSHMVFIGSGPLPLTAIDLHLQTGATVTCVDNDPVAVKQSQALLRRLNLDRKIKVVHASGEDAEFRDVTHAMVAALVPNQKAVAERILDQSPNAMIGVRSARGLRAVLYPPSDVQGLRELGLTYTGGSPTNDRVINTLLTFSPGPDLALRQVQAAKSDHDNCQSCTNTECPTRKMRLG